MASKELREQMAQDPRKSGKKRKRDGDFAVGENSTGADGEGNGGNHGYRKKNSQGKSSRKGLGL